MPGELQRAVYEKWALWRVHCITVLYSMCMFGHVALIIFFVFLFWKVVTLIRAWNELLYTLRIS